eukprot:TRINITY_DN42635_c0_g1_i1.p2 TRINITY_DN42635_c0_g1~~TRINITY_DN42635_c0_g1_i1.p2  ORF type:complete len:149 (+),score=0.06 TRINITY_DN42635_c0_g1_i1:278-724(+)
MFLKHIRTRDHFGPRKLLTNQHQQRRQPQSIGFIAYGLQLCWSEGLMSGLWLIGYQQSWSRLTPGQLWARDVEPEPSPILVSFIFPCWLDAISEEVKVTIVPQFGSLNDVAVEVPKLLDGFEGRDCGEVGTPGLRGVRLIEPEGPSLG